MAPIYWPNQFWLIPSEVLSWGQFQRNCSRHRSHECLWGRNSHVSPPHLPGAHVLKYRLAYINVDAPHSKMMTSCHGNAFRITGPLWGNPSVTGGFPSQRRSNAMLCCFNHWRSEQTVEETVRVAGNSRCLKPHATTTGQIICPHRFFPVTNLTQVIDQKVC